MEYDNNYSPYDLVEHLYLGTVTLLATLETFPPNRWSVIDSRGNILDAYEWAFIKKLGPTQKGFSDGI